MLNLSTMYYPLTSRPFLSGKLYREFSPCKALRPYIACYWMADADGMEAGGKEILIIPDTCMDIIIKINHTKQTISGYLSTLYDQPFMVSDQENREIITSFAIRFHFWAAHLFLNLDFGELQNKNLDLIALGWDWVELFQAFFYLNDTAQWIESVEGFLLKHLERMALNANLFNSVCQIITKPGRNSVKEICSYCCISQRQMERIFSKEIGLPLKRIMNLVRYQNVWRGMVLSSDFDIQDAVYRYGYTDQSHLLKEFRNFHGTTPKEAISIAHANR